MKIKPFQFRWNEALGRPECPYLRRWVFLFFGFSIRVHHWISSDDKRHFHDHPWAFWTIVLRGKYYDVSPGYTDKGVEYHKIDAIKAGQTRFRKAEHRHYVDVPEGGCWTLLFCMPKKRNWGFWVNNRMFRPLRYFSRYGHPPCSE